MKDLDIYKFKYGNCVISIHLTGMDKNRWVYKVSIQAGSEVAWQFPRGVYKKRKAIRDAKLWVRRHWNYKLKTVNMFSELPAVCDHCGQKIEIPKRLPFKNMYDG